MAITTLDLLIAGMLPPQYVSKAAVTAEAIGVLHSALYTAGRPGAAVAPSPGLAGAALTTYAGQIPFPAAVGGKNTHLAAWELGSAAGLGGAILCDRLWHNSGFTITTTTAQTVTSAAFPARDNNASTNGEGVMVAIEVSATLGNGVVTNTTMSYTNESGTAGRTATIASFPATALAGTFVPLDLAAGDTGVRSIQSLTLGTTYVSGTVHLVAYRPIAFANGGASGQVTARDGVQLGLPRMYDNSVPFMLLLPTATAVGATTSRVVYSQN